MRRRMSSDPIPNSFLQRYHGDPRLATLRQARLDQRSCTMGAVHGSLATVLIAALLRGEAEQQGQRPQLIVTADPDQIRADLEELGVDAVVLPEIDTHDHHEDLDDHSGLAGRLTALERLRTGAVLVADPRAVEQTLPDPVALAEGGINVRLGDARDLEELAEELVEAGLQLAPLVERPGQLAVRGGILDVFPLSAQHPVRIEFFDTSIDGLRHFDAFSQESTGKIEQATLTVDAGTLRTTTIWQLIGAQPITGAC